MKQLLMTALALTLLGACSSATKKEIEQEKAQFSDIQTREEMVANARQMLEESEELTQDEKAKLADLFAQVREESSKINAEISRSKSVLFKELTTKSYSEKKTLVLKNSIKNLYDKKIDLMMDAFKKSRKILGLKSAPEKFERQFLYLDNHHISIEQN